MTWWTNDQDVIDACATVGVGDVLDVKFFENRANGQSKGFAIVSFASEHSVKSALEKLPNRELHGQRLVALPYTKAALAQFENATKRNDPQPRTDKKSGAVAGAANTGSPSGPQPLVTAGTPQVPAGAKYLGAVRVGPATPAPAPAVAAATVIAGSVAPAPPASVPMAISVPSHTALTQPPPHGIRLPPPAAGLAAMAAASAHPTPPGVPPGAVIHTIAVPRPGFPPTALPPPAPGMGPPRPGFPPGVLFPPATLAATLSHNPAIPPPGFQHPPGALLPPGAGVRPLGLPPGSIAGFAAPPHLGPPPLVVPTASRPPPTIPNQIPGAPAPHINPNFYQQQVAAAAQAAAAGAVAVSGLGAIPNSAAMLMSTLPPGVSVVAAAPSTQATALPQVMTPTSTPGATAQAVAPAAGVSIYPQATLPAPTPLIPPASALSIPAVESMSEAEFEEIMNRNKTVSSSAISRAVSDASAGDYASAIETLVTAISLIRQSKVSQDDRCKILIASLQDTLHGIEV